MSYRSPKTGRFITKAAFKRWYAPKKKRRKRKPVPKRKRKKKVESDYYDIESPADEIEFEATVEYA